MTKATLIALMSAAIAAAAMTGPALAHGGGCRKSSPPGQCCHLERKTDKVHCHAIKD